MLGCNDGVKKKKKGTKEREERKPILFKAIVII